MTINYKKELEDAAKGMILVHEADLLIKMIVRTIVQKVKVSHAGVLLQDREKDTYILNFSRGARGLRIPQGFARMDKDNPLIRFFGSRTNRVLFEHGALVYKEAQRLLKRKMPAEAKQLLRQVLYQMEIFDVQVSIPSYFREELLGVLLLGKKLRGKPFLREELDFFAALASDVAMAIRNAWLFKELEAELEKKHRLLLNTTFALAAEIEARDHYTHGHTARVTELSVIIAKKLGQRIKDIGEEEFLQDLHIAGLLHDIGKIGVPDSILNKQGPLDSEERKKMQEHTSIGATILQRIPELARSILGVKYHHEKYDGSGYPEGLKAEQIPLIAAIISVADSFDAMTTDRPYRKGLSKDRAVEEIRSLSGKQFHPLIAEVFCELYREGEI
jgi:HD-GYP domain-containing protein (c-di-GMP phosphodiesterase class II)